MVAKKEGVDFEGDYLEYFNQKIKKSNNISSMYQDLIRNRRTEIEHINGAVVKRGGKYKINCLVNQSIVTIIKELEKN